VDRSEPGPQLHHRNLPADARRPGGQKRASAPAHLDSRSHGRAHPGQRFASRGLLRHLRRLSRRAHAQLRRLAHGLGSHPYMSA
jgi:hypothetical protein